MSPFLFIQAGFVGAFAAVGFGAAWIWLLSRREHTILYFSVHCLLCCLTSICVVAIACADNTDAMNLALHARTIIGLTLLITTVLIVSRLTGVDARWYARFIAVFAAVFIIFDLVIHPVVGPATDVRRVATAFGDEIFMPVLPPGSAWLKVVYLVVLSVSVFSLFASWRLWSKDRFGGMLVGLASAGLLLAHTSALAADVLRIKLAYHGALPVVAWVFLIAVLMAREYTRRGEELAATDEQLRAMVQVLGERVKELRCLHQTARILQDGKRNIAGWLHDIVNLLPSALQYPQDAAAHISLGDLDYVTPGFTQTPWLLRAGLVVGNDKGVIEVVYLKEKAPKAEDPFLAEERNLINSLAEMVRTALEGRATENALRAKEESLRREKEFIDTLMDSLPGIVYLHDGNRLLKWNKVVEQVTGYSHEEVAQRPPTAFFDATDAITIAAAIERAFTEGHVEIESNLLTKNGQRIPYYFKGVRLQTEQGPCVLGFGIDISERRLLEDQFRQAQKMEAIGHLAGGVAHDFNNLLTVISGYSELLLSALPESDPSHEALTAIHQAGEQAASLTTHLLAFSRQAALQPKVLDVNEIVRETQKMLRRLIGEDVELSTVLAPDVNRIKIDPGHFGQMLMNLAVNARDAMPKGGKLTIATDNVRIDEDYCRVHVKAKPGRYVRVSAIDTGCGMTPEVKARIFEPFFTTKGVGKGTGLGLAMVYGIAEQSGGHIEVQSEVGRGTTFDLYFPAVDEAATRQMAHDAAEPVGHGMETILLVEDDNAVRALSVVALQSHGYQVLIAANGTDALRVASDAGATIDMLLTDVVMPGLSGRELAESLHSQFPKMRVLYVSGYTDDAVVRHGLLQDRINFMQKPYTPLMLARKVRDVLDER